MCFPALVVYVCSRHLFNLIGHAAVRMYVYVVIRREIVSITQTAYRKPL